MTTLVDERPQERPMIELSSTAPVPLSRLVRVELRKTADTRAGMWLLVAIAVITAGAMAVFSLTTDAADRTFLDFMAVSATPQGLLLPVLGILLVTSEWGQRTALVTFTLTPVRSRVLLAKVVAAVLLGLAAIAVATGVGALATVIGGGPDAWHGLGPDQLGKFTLLQTMGILQGVALGLLILNSAGAIVTFFLVPTLFTVLAGMWSKMADIQPWIDLGFAQQPLFGAADLAGEQWLQLASSFGIWVGLPFLLGAARVLRSEVK